MGFAITEDTMTPALRGLVSKLSPPVRMKFVLQWGTRVKQKAQTTALGKGGRSFWRSIARATNLSEVRQDVVEVATDHVAAMQKQHGGPIVAKGKSGGGADALTIPIAEEARWRRVAEFTLAHRLFAIGKDLPERGVLGFDEGGDFVPLYALRRRTASQAADPFFPDEGEVLDMGISVVKKLVA